jgi:hypothetical protein
MESSLVFYEFFLGSGHVAFMNSFWAVVMFLLLFLCMCSDFMFFSRTCVINGQVCKVGVSHNFHTK